MKRLLIFTLLVPLMLFLSVGSHARDDNNAPSYLKGGLVETAFELPSVEVAPDLDDVLLASQNLFRPTDVNFDALTGHAFATSSETNLLCCRGPPSN